ncbi:hypothetical protein JQX08_17175 [Pseudomonas sp. UL073]|uniref:DUF6160 domain-containing protein n=1 Tax=Zestomonas insulae TaxID=2809017 RepID=A0ABS2IKN8_9GAMM|nr:DUF6160 family protein [Pseudomonas insulae]MBM7062448.1 hypothetical protein [Pseudomonas insulae]
MPSILQLRPLLAGLALLCAGPGQAALLDLDNQTLSEVSGQAGISIRVDLQAQIRQLRWDDDGGSVSLRNVKIDNGCVSPGDCPAAIAFGPAQLGLSLPFLGINVPTLQVDVVTAGNGQKQLQLTLPDLTTINQQLVQGGLDPVRIRVRLQGDMYVGESRLGTLAIRDINDLRGTIKVWGH